MAFLLDKCIFVPLNEEILAKSHSFTCGNEDNLHCKQVFFVYNNTFLIFAK